MLNVLDSYRPLIENIISSTVTSSAVLDHSDLLQIGNIAALNAIKKYDPSYGCNIRSFVRRAVKNSIYNEAARFIGVFTVDHRVTALASKQYKLGLKNDIYHNFDVLTEDYSVDNDVSFGSIDDILERVIVNVLDRDIIYGHILGDKNIKFLCRKYKMSKTSMYRKIEEVKQRIINIIYE